ncbi:glycosyltransferase family 90 protein [Pseudomonas palleroniana]|uniref:hypothetical protein n=1 Tax=Pseudomonas palleroniana TaxID=191390 RepID=UPI003AFFD71C
MNTIQELKDRSDTLTVEMESIQRDLAPFEEALESPEVVQQGRQRAVQVKSTITKAHRLSSS